MSDNNPNPSPSGSGCGHHFCGCGHIKMPPPKITKKYDPITKTVTDVKTDS